MILGCSSKKDVYPLSNLKQLEASVRRIYRQSITYDEKECIVILIPEYSVDELETEFDSLLKKHPYLRIGIGSSVMRLEQLHLSYRNALTAYQLATAVKEEAILCFDHLGIYQVLAGVKDPQTLYPHFVKQILGPLMEYDSEHHSNYMLILEEYFENDCSITQTANATFFHQNTLKYKVKNIKEILGYDITENKHRVNIILALSMLHMGEDFFGES